MGDIAGDGEDCVAAEVMGAVKRHEFFTGQFIEGLFGAGDWAAERLVGPDGFVEEYRKV